MNPNETQKDHANLDPITKAPGAHPIGVGIGAATGGMAAGAAAGTVAAGPIGTVLGAAVGAVVGGLGGKAVAEHFDPTVEAQYWRDNHANQAYVADGTTYDDYEPAYRLGSINRDRYANKGFDEVEPDLAKDYEGMKGESSLSWDHAKHATRAAWDRVTNAAS
jgi:hypothetical protein